ncbi:MAG: VIT1/CCC1 transporter family protein [Chloroflexota bacterium]
MFRFPHRHEELHIKGGRSIGEAILGSADGLTTPFALAAGLSGVVASTGVVLLAGSAEMDAGGIAMGLGGYLSTKSYNELYARELAQEYREVGEIPEQERREVRHIFEQKGFAGEDLDRAVRVITDDKDRWVKFMMREELGMREEDLRPPARSAAIVGGSYMAGALVPLLPYLVAQNMLQGLLYSSILTLVALLLAGVVKGKLSGRPWLLSGLETAGIGALAAGTAYGFAKLLSSAGVGQ